MIHRGRFTGARLALFYVVAFLVIGVLQPFWPIWLASRGLSATAIGVTLALSIGIKVFSTPVAAHLADRSGQRRGLIIALLAGSVVTFALFGVVEGLPAILIVSLVFYALWPPVVSLAESLTLLAAARHGFEYGRIRLWGSLGFIAAALAAGWILSRSPPEAVYWMVLGAAAMCLITAFGLPDLRGETSRSPRLPVIEALRDRGFVRALVACGLVQGSHATYYAFGALYWQGLAFSEGLIGTLWAWGVVAEIILFAFAGRAVARLGPSRLIVVSGIGAGVRWLLLATTFALPWLIIAQALHAVSFGCAHLGAMHYIGTRVAPHVSATAQSLYSGIVWGVFLGLGLLAAGPLYARFGGDSYALMAAIGFLGTVAAWPLMAAHSRGDP
ncbi:MAG: MFS transporter [Rhodospirillales bacterium]|jgi:PPP family 3-phenylpropionic acid transporter|nr:MFS transporter [Rhodospirillales bacterium]